MSFEFPISTGDSIVRDPDALRPGMEKLPESVPGNFQAELDNVLMTKAGIIAQLLQGSVDQMDGRNDELIRLNEKMKELRQLKSEGKAPEDVDIQLENLRGEVESLTAVSQTDFVRLQSWMFRHNNCYELLGAAIQKWFEPVRQIIGYIGR